MKGYGKDLTPKKNCYTAKLTSIGFCLNKLKKIGLLKYTLLHIFLVIVNVISIKCLSLNTSIQNRFEKSTPTLFPV